MKKNVLESLNVFMRRFERFSKRKTPTDEKYYSDPSLPREMLTKSTLVKSETFKSLHSKALLIPIILVQKSSGA